MKFEIDVSGYDLFTEGYVICVASDCGIVKGFKFKRELIGTLQDKWGKNLYRYSPTKNKLGIFKVRIYCSIVYNLFKKIDSNHNEIELVICRDFAGHENDVTQNMNHFIGKLGGRKIKSITFSKLPPQSNAHQYAYAMAKDKYNFLTTYVDIGLEDIESFLKRPIIKKEKKNQRV